MSKRLGYLMDVHYLSIMYQKGHYKDYQTSMMKIFWDDKDREFFWWDFPEGKKHKPYAYVYNLNKKEDIFSEDMNKPEGHTYTVSKNFKLDKKGKSRVNGIVQNVKKYNPMLRKTLNLTKYYFKSPDDVSKYLPDDKVHIPSDEQDQDIKYTHDEKRKRQNYWAYENHVRYTVRFAIDTKLWYGMPYYVDLDTITTHKPEDYHLQADSIEKLLKPFNINQTLINELLPLLLVPMPILPSVALDIEVLNRGSVMPDSNVAPEPITAVAFYFSDEKVYHKKKGLVVALDHNTRKIGRGFNPKIMDLISTGELDVRYCNSEKKLLEVIKDILYESSCALLTTFMGDKFDLLYLHNRMKLLRISSPFRKRGRGEKQYMSYEPTDIDGDLIPSAFKIHLDLYKFFKHPFIQGYAFGGKYKSFGLDAIAKGLINEEKIEHELDIYEMKLWDLIYYNYQDARITSKLMYFDNGMTLKLINMFMRLGLETFSQCNRYGITDKHRNLFLWRCYTNNWIEPNKWDFPSVKALTKSTTGKSFKGAYNVEPKLGIFFNIRCDDFEGLYTNIIANNNLSPETINCEHDECKSNKLPVPELDSYWICTKERGLAAELIEFITKIRSVVFKPMGKENPAMWKPVEQSLKVWGNAAYGFLSTEDSNWYFLPVAEGTTGVGRNAIIRLERYAIALGITVVRGDTDSLVLHGATDESIAKLYEFSLNELGFKLDLEYKGIWIINSIRKKNYLVFKEDGEMLIKGLKLKKSNTPAIIRNAGMKVIDITKKMKSEKDIPLVKAEIEKYTRRIIKKIRNKQGNLSEYVYYTKITKNINNYKVQPQHVKAAVLEAKDTINKLPNAIKHTVSIDSLIEIGHVQSYIKIDHKPNAYPLKLGSNASLNSNKYLEELESSLAPLIELFDIQFTDLIAKQKTLGSMLK